MEATKTKTTTTGVSSPVNKPTSANRTKSTSTKSSATKSAFRPTVVPSHSPELMNLITDYKANSGMLSSVDGHYKTEPFKSYSVNDAHFGDFSNENNYFIDPDDLIKAYCLDLGVSINDLDEADESKLLSNVLKKTVNNGYYAYKINPSFNPDFSYLSRNLLVNRRLALKKQKENSTGLVPICPPIVLPIGQKSHSLPNASTTDRPRSHKTNDDAKSNQSEVKSENQASKYVFRSPIISLVLSRQ